jgi:uncharacterized protein (TIGR03437 family)
VEAGRGPFRPNEPLASFRNQNAFGSWRLGIENDESSRTGFMTGFSVTITGTPFGPPTTGPDAIVNTASFKNGAVAPGEQLAIFGVNLGPVGGSWAPANSDLPTSLGPTSVTFDGTRAPLYFTGDRLVAAQAPTTLVPGSTTSVQVNSASGSSRVIRLSVVPAKPGIFTYEAGGGGQAKAINQDGSMNGDGSIDASYQPAAAGSVLAVYATGLGPVEPPIPQGTRAPASPLSVVTVPVTATIGGRQAVVTYAGAAPGLVGMYQVNILVPALAPSGTNRLLLSAGGNFSQEGVTVQIK